MNSEEEVLLPFSFSSLLNTYIYMFNNNNNNKMYQPSGDMLDNNITNSSVYENNRESLTKRSENDVRKVMNIQRN